MTKVIYLIGSLRHNEMVNKIGVQLREAGYDVFDDWSSVGPEADDYWKEYAQRRDMTYKEALNGWSAEHVFEFDKAHLDRADMAILVHPAGKSCHLELGYVIGSGKPGIIYWPEGEPPQERWDVMVKFARTAFSFEELLEELKEVSK
jgi:hypothetical protein